MAKHFWHGRQIAHIVAVYKNSGDDQARFPSKVTTVDGGVFVCTGTPAENLVELESIIERNREEAWRKQAADWELCRANEQAEEARRTLADIENVIASKSSPEAATQAAIVLRGWLSSGRNYLRTEEKAAVVQWLESFGGQA